MLGPSKTKQKGDSSMKHLLSMSILAAGLLLLAPAIQAQDYCSNWSLWTLRGTYAFTGTAWQDLSEINPALPKGYAPVPIVGAFTVNYQGDVTGWALVNAGGLQMTAEFVNSQFSAPKADCSFSISLSMRIKEFGESIAGPYSYAGVISGDVSTLEIALMMLGTGPGSHMELNHAKRISMKFD
jgi:hypothetical protein